MKKFYFTMTLLLALLLSLSTASAQNETQSLSNKETSNHQELRNKSLVPSKEEKLEYEAFLKAKNTGLIRLLPREKYDLHQQYRPSDEPRWPNGDLLSSQELTRRALEATESRAPLIDPLYEGRRLRRPSQLPIDGKKSGDVRGGGSYYSFTLKTHDYGQATELSLDQGQLRVGFYGANYGFMTDLGDVPLEAIKRNTATVKPLAAYEPTHLEGEARLEFQRFGNGVALGGINVKSRLPLKPNSTYLLRAVNYDESDVLVAFRVVGIDSDGSALILWKKLKSYSTPRLFRTN